LKTAEIFGKNVKSQLMQAPEKQYYEFGRFRVDPVKRVLLRDTKPVPLTPKALDILLVLIRNNERVLDKDELMRLVWPNAVVEENNLTRNVSALRKVLGESPNEHQYIVTIPGQGYRFVADVKVAAEERADFVFERLTRAEIVVQEEEEDESEANRNAQIRTDNFAFPTSKAGQTKSLTGFRGSWFRIHGKTVPLALALLITAVTAVIFGLSKLTSIKRTENRLAVALPKMETAWLTRSGNCARAAISPDGRYIVYVALDRGAESLWAKQVATTSSIELVPPAEVSYGGITFSSDGNYIYYGMRKRDERAWKLYRMAVPGGPSTMLREGVWGITLSPDNKKFAFVREDASRGESALIVSNLDGTEERKLSARNYPDRLRVPAWSPDGKIIAVSDGNADTSIPNINVIAVDAENGTEKPITSERWPWIGAVAWLTDGSGLLMVARDLDSTSNQIWLLSYPGGETSRITNDLSYYSAFDLSLTPDSRLLVSSQVAYLTNVWVQSAEESDSGQDVTPGEGGYWGLSWAPDGRIVYSSGASRKFDLWIMEPDGTGQKQLTADSGANGSPAVSPDGRYVVFMSDRSGPQNIWRMDRDGGNLRRLTSGSGEDRPSCSPDGKWVVYTSTYSAMPTLWKVSIDGGEPVQLTNSSSLAPAISHDGRRIAYFYTDREANFPKMAVTSFAGGQPVKLFDVPSSVSASAGIRWTPNDRALSYVDTRAGVSNLWSQPLDGSPAKQLTRFRSSLIFFFDWSRDGKQFACSRGAWTSDIVLIKDFR
jgi:Tol biopolymer transport system component/DNA-binding winged helix-turn-helix (wHTH) protein